MHNLEIIDATLYEYSCNYQSISFKTLLSNTIYILFDKIEHLIHNLSHVPLTITEFL